MSVKKVIDSIFPITELNQLTSEISSDGLISTIYNENCIDTMARFPDEYIDLVVTSPPYDNLRNYHGYEFDFEKISKELVRVIKKGGIIVWVVGDESVKGSETGTSFRQALHFMDLGLRLNDTMIYAKKNYPPQNNGVRYEQCFEYMFVLSKRKPKTFNPIKVLSKDRKAVPTGAFYNKDDTIKPTKKRSNNEPTLEYKVKGNIWYYATSNDNKYKHPARFPEQLVKDHILSWSNERDIVYDPFNGSGTTGVMAKALRRHFIGSEISKEYCDIAVKRMNEVF